MKNIILAKERNRTYSMNAALKVKSLGFFCGIITEIRMHFIVFEIGPASYKCFMNFWNKIL